MENYDFCLRPRGRSWGLLSAAISLGFVVFLAYESYKVLWVNEAQYDTASIIAGVVVFGSFIAILCWFIVKYLGMFLEKIRIHGENITVSVYRKKEYTIKDITEARIEYIRSGTKYLECLTPYFNGKKCRLFLEIGEHMNNYDLWCKYIQDAGVKITAEENNG